MTEMPAPKPGSFASQLLCTGPLLKHWSQKNTFQVGCTEWFTPFQLSLSPTVSYRETNTTVLQRVVRETLQPSGHQCAIHHLNQAPKRHVPWPEGTTHRDATCKSMAMTSGSFRWTLGKQNFTHCSCLMNPRDFKQWYQSMFESWVRQNTYDYNTDYDWDTQKWEE